MQRETAGRRVQEETAKNPQKVALPRRQAGLSVSVSESISVSASESGTYVDGRKHMFACARRCLQAAADTYFLLRGPIPNCLGRGIAFQLPNTRTATRPFRTRRAGVVCRRLGPDPTVEGK